MNKKIFRNEKTLIKYLRKNGDSVYNNATNEYLINEAFNQYFVCEDYYNKTDFYKII
tara:strand:+ start:942 stop:1112 length:171 start_codon:yes stop_codon:yes gene_type:complete